MNLLKTLGDIFSDLGDEDDGLGDGIAFLGVIIYILAQIYFYFWG